MNRVEGKVVLITGGNKGIGKGIALSILEKGGKVAITSQSLQKAEATAKDFAEQGYENVLPLQLDVRKYQEQTTAVGKVVEQFGKLDVVIANAGIGYFAPIETMEVDKWNEVIDTNLTGVFYSIRSSVEALKKTKGYFITISSLAGTNFFAQGAAYNASKFGVTGFTQAAMLDLRKLGVNASTIMPGSVTSYFNGHEPNEKDAWKIQPEDIGKLVVDLLQMHPRTLPSKIEVRPSMPPKK